MKPFCAVCFVMLCDVVYSTVVGHISCGVHSRGATARRSRAAWHYTKGVPLSTAPQQCSSGPKGFHRPLLTISVAVHSTSPTAHNFPVAWWCTEGVPLPTAPQRCGSTPKESHCQLLQCGCALKESPCLLLPNSVAVH